MVVIKKTVPKQAEIAKETFVPKSVESDSEKDSCFDDASSVTSDGKHDHSISEDVHKLATCWTLLFNYKPAMSSLDSANWNDEFFEVSDIDTIEKFWTVQNHISLPDKISHKSRPNMYLFRKGVRPTWEDEANVGGGSWTLIIPKAKRFELLNKLWFEMMIAVVGNAFPQEFDDKINGILVQRRQKEDRISLWVKDFADEQLQNNIGNWMKETMGLSRYDKITGTPFENNNKEKNMSFLYRSTHRDTYTV